MNKKLLIVGIAVLLLVVGLSGCTNPFDPLSVDRAKLIGRWEYTDISFEQYNDSWLVLHENGTYREKIYVTNTKNNTTYPRTYEGNWHLESKEIVTWSYYPYPIIKYHKRVEDFLVLYVNSFPSYYDYEFKSDDRISLTKYVYMSWTVNDWSSSGTDYLKRSLIK